MSGNEKNPKDGQRAQPPFGRVVNITKTFQAAGNTVPAVKDVSFQFRKGDLISLLGPSGCGKTTVLKMMGGLVPSSGGGGGGFLTATAVTAGLAPCFFWLRFGFFLALLATVVVARPGVVRRP